jgi:hypothetical protein
MTRSTLLGLMVVLGTGCTENAALEISLDLPLSRTETLRDGGMAPRQFAFVQIRRASDNPFDVDWDGRDMDPVQLSGEDRTVDQFTVLSEDDTVDLNLKIRFCIDPGCNGFEDQPAPAVWFAIEHPFYIGERTFWEASTTGMREPLIETIPMADPTDIVCNPACDDFHCGPPETTTDCDINFVDRCEVRGCVSGDFSPSGYCRMGGDMSHFCEGN